MGASVTTVKDEWTPFDPFSIPGERALIGALVQNFRIEKRLAAEGYARVEPVPLGLTMGILVLAFSVLSILFVVL